MSKRPFHQNCSRSNGINRKFWSDFDSGHSSETGCHLFRKLSCFSAFKALQTIIFCCHRSNSCLVLEDHYLNPASYPQQMFFRGCGQWSSYLWGTRWVHFAFANLNIAFGQTNTLDHLQIDQSIVTVLKFLSEVKIWKVEHELRTHQACWL